MAILGLPFAAGNFIRGVYEDPLPYVEKASKLIGLASAAQLAPTNPWFAASLAANQVTGLLRSFQPRGHYPKWQTANPHRGLRITSPVRRHRMRGRRSHWKSLLYWRPNSRHFSTHRLKSKRRFKGSKRRYHAPTWRKAT